MEDNVSIKSSDSVTTSGEYEIVSELLDCPTTAGAAASIGASAANGSKATAATDAGGKVKAPAESPTLRIANNGDLTDLEKNMHEVIHDEQDGTASSVQASSSAGAAIVESIVGSSTTETGSASAVSTGMHRKSHLYTHIHTLVGEAHAAYV